MFNDQKKKFLTDVDYGPYGGQYVIETLLPALDQLDMEFHRAVESKQFKSELDYYLSTYVGRPTPLYYASRLTDFCNGGRIFLKREDLTHTGAHKINNTMAQALLAKRMNKSRVIAETGAGQHGVATAAVASLLNLRCDIFMGAADIKRQQQNLFRMKLLGANVISVNTGTRRLKDAMSSAMRDWISTLDNTHYIVGSVAGPSPFPKMVREFQKVIGEETKLQMIALDGKLPDYLIASVGGGSNAIGLFHPFYEESDVKMVGVEAAGRGISTNKHAAPLRYGKVGILHGSKSYVMLDKDGQVMDTESIAAGLDYPGVGPQHAWYKDSGRAVYESVTDKEALFGFRTLARLEGIIPAFESAHALAYAIKLAKKLKKDQSIVVSLSGRGDKDLDSAMSYLD